MCNDFLSIVYRGDFTDNIYSLVSDALWESVVHWDFELLSGPSNTIA